MLAGGLLPGVAFFFLSDEIKTTSLYLSRSPDLPLPLGVAAAAGGHNGAVATTACPHHHPSLLQTVPPEGKRSAVALLLLCRSFGEMVFEK